MHKQGVVLLVLVSAVIVINNQGLVLGHKQYSQYDFPPLYTFDDYDRCLHKNATGLSQLSNMYCMVYAEVEPNNSSDLWHRIMDHWESNKFHYRYDRLFFGVCLDRCTKFTQTTLDEGEENNSLITDDQTLSTEFTAYYEKVHKRPLDLEIRSKYSQMLHKCLNEDFEMKYNLKLKIFIKYCESPNEIEEQGKLATKDPAEILLTKIIQIIALLIVLSSIYDFCLKCQQTEDNQTNEFYKNNLEHTSSRLLSSFSIFRNYYRIVQPYRGAVALDFAFLDGYRSVTTLLVIYAHIFYTTFLHISNPEFLENYAHNTLGSMFLNTPVAIEIFMVMSGLFFYLKFNQARYITPQTSLRKCMKIYFLLFASRFLRYVPSVALLVLVNATVIQRFVDGPFWRHISDQNRVFSRENWWKNILMINNYSQADTISPHTWYLAADLQLFAFYGIILIVMAKYPQHKYRILKILAFLAFAIPACGSYLLKMRSAFVIKGESYRSGYFTDPEYYYQYTPFYNNLGGYLFGICVAELYLNYLNKPEVQKHYREGLKLELFGYLGIPIAGAILWVGSIMMFKEPSLWTALYSGLHRNFWILGVCGVPLLAMTCKSGKATYEFCCLPMFRVLARLSFQIFIWHLLILQVMKGHIRQPFHMNGLYFTTLTILTFAASTIVAFFIALFVEYPFAQLLETLQPKRRKTKTEPTKETKVQ